jgi:hypothetical protein
MAMAEELGWDLYGFREAFREAFSKGFVKASWEAPLVWVPNAIKYNRPASPNVVRSWSGTWDELPECALKLEAYLSFKAFLKGFSKAFAEAFEKACRQPLPNQEQEQEQEQEHTKHAEEIKNAACPLPAKSACASIAAVDLCPSSRAPDVLRVFEHWRSCGHDGDYLTPHPGLREWIEIEHRLSKDSLTVDDMCLAIDGLHADPWEGRKRNMQLMHAVKSYQAVKRLSELADADPNEGLPSYWTKTIDEVG